MSDPRRERWTLITGSLMILATVAVGFVLWFTRSVMVPFVLAVFVVAVVAPVSDVLQRNLRLPRWLAMVGILLLVLVVAAGVAILLRYTGEEVLESLGRYTTHAEEIAQVLFEELSPEANAQPEANAEDLEPWWMPKVREQLAKLPVEFGNVLSQGVRWAVGSTFEVVSTVGLMLIFLLFLLAGLDPSRMQRGVYAEIERKMRHYLSIKATISAVTGLLVGAILGLLGLQLATVFGVLTFLLNFVPSLGSIIATLLPIPIAYAQFVFEPSSSGTDPNWLMFWAAIALPGTVQILIGNVVEPRVMGEGLELHPIVILIALVFWGLLWGPIGAILAVPITAVIRIATARFVSLGVVSDVMAGRLPSE